MRESDSVINLIAYNKNPNIGVIGKSNDKFALVPVICPLGFASAVSETLGVEVHRINICGTFLIGAMVAMNNKGAVLSKHAYKEEINEMKKLDINAGVVKEKFTALGNLVLLNDNGAIASKLFGKKTIAMMKDVLDCEVEAADIGGFRAVGSAGVATNKGALVHPMVSEEELKWIEDILKVSVDIGTVNRGVGFVRTGIIANKNGALVGNETTGPEIARIEDSLDLI